MYILGLMGIGNPKILLCLIYIIRNIKFSCSKIPILGQNPTFWQHCCFMPFQSASRREVEVPTYYSSTNFCLSYRLSGRPTTVLFSGVGSNHALRGPQIQVVGVALIIEFCDHNIPFLKVVLDSNLVKTCANKV